MRNAVMRRQAIRERGLFQIFDCNQNIEAEIVLEFCYLKNDRLEVIRDLEEALNIRILREIKPLKKEYGSLTVDNKKYYQMADFKYIKKVEEYE